MYLLGISRYPTCHQMKAAWVVNVLGTNTGFQVEPPVAGAGPVEKPGLEFGPGDRRGIGAGPPGQP